MAKPFTAMLGWLRRSVPAPVPAEPAAEPTPAVVIPMPSPEEREARALLLRIPEPPTHKREVAEAYALFLDEDERTVLYKKPWPYAGCPSDEATGRTEWQIEGQLFSASRRDRAGNWIFRRCGK